MLHLQGPLNEVYSEEGFAIYIGSAANAANTKALKEANIRYILNVSDRVRFKRMDGPPVVMYQVPLSDFGDTPLSSVLEECFDVINEAREAKGNVLVHCQGGVNRSPTVVIAFLMHVIGWNLKRAWEHVKEKRPAASPHEKYMQQLIDIERELFDGVTTVDFAEYSSVSLQASLRRIRQQQVQSTQLPFQDSQGTISENGNGVGHATSASSATTLLTTTSASSLTSLNGNNVTSTAEIVSSSSITNNNINSNNTNISNNNNITTTTTSTTAEIKQITSDKQQSNNSNNFNHFSHHLPQLNLECIS
jgi:atypical dual specificity phosphatase